MMYETACLRCQLASRRRTSHPKIQSMKKAINETMSKNISIVVIRTNSLSHDSSQVVNIQCGCVPLFVNMFGCGQCLFVQLVFNFYIYCFMIPHY